MPKLQSFLECSVRGDKGDPDHPKPETLRKYIADFGEDVLFSSDSGCYGLSSRRLETRIGTSFDKQRRAFL